MWNPIDFNDCHYQFIDKIQELYSLKNALDLKRNFVKLLYASGESWTAAVQETVEPGAVIKTDGWRGYNGLRSLGYDHQVIRKTADVGENLLPVCHREAGLIKRWLAGTHPGAVSQEHLAYYLDEYRFRFNRRTSRFRGKLFHRLLQNAVAIEPTTYRNMTTTLRGRKPDGHKM